MICRSKPSLVPQQAFPAAGWNRPLYSDNYLFPRNDNYVFPLDVSVASYLVWLEPGRMGCRGEIGQGCAAVVDGARSGDVAGRGGQGGGDVAADGKEVSEVRKNAERNANRNAIGGLGVIPFEEVWPEIEALLRDEPRLKAKTIFEELQAKYPGRFSGWATSHAPAADPPVASQRRPEP